MKKVFITGGIGFIGSHVVRKFLSEGYKVVVYDSLVQWLTPDISSRPVNPLFRLKDVWGELEFVRGDILDKDFLRRAIVRAEPDIIVHMASMPLASMAVVYTVEAYKSIIEGTVNMLEIVRDLDRETKFVHTSSSMVYGDFESSPVDENHPKNPKDFYGAFKYASEIIVNTYGKREGINFTILRPSAVYGPTDGNRRVVQKFVEDALDGKPIAIDGDGGMALDFTWVEDLAEGFFLAAVSKNSRGRVYNVTRGRQRTLKEVAGIVIKEVGSGNIVYKKAPDYIPRRGTLDITRAKSELGFAPQVDLEDGVARYIKHLRNENVR